jgi:hypothetical protein
MRVIHYALFVLCVLFFTGNAVAQSSGEMAEDPFFVMKDRLAGKDAPAKGKIRILAWGDNSSGQLGTGGAGHVTNIPVIATKVEEILQPDFKILQLASSANSFCLLRSDKTVWCWGAQFFGPEERKFGPIRIDGLPPVRELIGGSSAQICATTTEDQAWCWSGDAPQRYRAEWANAPELVALSDSFAKVYLAGDAGCGITPKGEAWCWGGQRGGGYPQKIKAPLPVRKASNNGWSRGCALLIDGTAWCWDHPSTSWGDGFGKDEKFTELQRMHLYTGLREDGTVWRSDGTNFPHGINIAPGKPLGGVAKISIGMGSDYIEGNFTCALTKEGRVWCWSGAGFSGIHYPMERDFASPVRGPDAAYYLSHVSDIVVSGDSAIAVVQDKDYDLVAETDASRIFYSLVYSRKFNEAKESFRGKADKLSKDDPLAQEALIRAIEYNRPDLVKIIAGTGIDLELPGQSESALWKAVKNWRQNASNDNASLRILLAYGANAETPGEGGRTPVRFLEGWGDQYSYIVNLMKDYIKNGNKLSDAEMDKVNRVDMNTGQTPDPNKRKLASWIRPPAKVVSSALLSGPPPEEVKKPAAEPVKIGMAENVAYVRPCEAGEAKPDMLNYDVIFRGKARVPDQTAVMVFDVIKAYKGDIGSTISIVAPKGKQELAREGAEALVFAHRRKESSGFALFCTPIQELGNRQGILDPAIASVLIDLEMFSAKVKATGVFEKEYHADIQHYVLHPDDVREQEWLEAAKVLEAGNDYERAAKVYAAAMAKVTSQRGTVGRAVRDRYSPERCDGLYAADWDTPPYLQEFGGQNAYMLGYGRALFMMGRYKDALRPLCLDNPGTYYQPARGNAAYYRLQALLKLGEKEEVDVKHLDFSGTRLSEADMSGLQIERSNFADAWFSKINFHSSKLGGTSFENAKIRQSDFTGADLRGADFKGAAVDATMTGADLAGAIYDSKTTWPSGFDPATAGAVSVESAAPARDKFGEIPAEFDIVAVGVYSGVYPNGINSAFDYYPTGRIDIEVKKADKPIFIAVGSHDTADWHFHLDKGVRIAGVIVGGLYQQSVFGIPGDVQVIKAGSFYGPFDTDGHGAALKKVLKELVGKDTVQIYDQHQTGLFQIK